MENSEEIPNTINDLDEESSTDETPPFLDSEGLGNASSDDQEKQLATKAEEAQESQNKYLRLAAEFENYKKRALRDQREHVRFGNEQLLKELLPVIDNLERALKSGKETTEGSALLEGVELTLKQSLEILEKFGVKPMECVGQPFDPACHQAVAQVENDSVPEHAVLDDYQKGYFLHDRVLRAAMVSVAKPPAVPETSTGEPEGQNLEDS